MKIPMLLPLVGIFSLVVNAADRIQPADLQYQGAFRLPNLAGWEWGGEGLAYYPKGDPTGPADEFTGSLYAAGRHGHVAEINIPAPVRSPKKNLEELPTAKMLQDFKNMEAFKLPYGDVRMGMEYLPKQGSQTTDKLYFCWGSHYSFGDEFGPSMSWSELNLSNPKITGGWYLLNGSETQLSTFHTSDYLFGVPPEWAEKNAAGNMLISGRFRDGGLSGKGPTMYAFAPWKQGNPPGPGAKLKYIPLLQYNDDHPIVNYSHDDSWKGGAWLQSGAKSAIVLAGTKALGKTWYGENPVCGGDKGYWSDGTQGQMIFYDTEELAAVAAGKKKPHEPQPYAVLNVDPFLYRKYCTNDHNHVGEITFNRQHGLLFLFEPYAYDAKPLIHVWRISQDTSPPNNVLGFKASVKGQTVTLAWSPAQDAESGIAGYEIYRGKVSNPIEVLASVGEVVQFDDSTGQPETQFHYRIKAVNGSGMKSAGYSPNISSLTEKDTQPPTVLTVSSAGGLTGLIVVFSEKVNQTTAENPANFQLSGGVQVLSATLLEDGKTVVLKTSEHIAKTNYSLSVSSITDLSNNGIALNTASLPYSLDLELKLTIVRPTTYLSSLGRLQKGDPVYVDRDYKIESFWSGYNAEEFLAIKTFNDDKSIADDQFLVQESNVNVEVWVGVANQNAALAGSSPLNWMGDWANTKKSMVREPNSQGSFKETVHYTFFSRIFPKGRIVLSGNKGIGDNMYVVMVKPYWGAVSIPKNKSPGPLFPSRNIQMKISDSRLSMALGQAGLLPAGSRIRIFDGGGKMTTALAPVVAPGSGEIVADWNTQGIRKGFYLIHVPYVQGARIQKIFLTR